MSTRKLSITVDEGLVRELRGRVGKRGVSGFVSRAIRHELEREELSDLLKQLEAELGPPDDTMTTEAAASFDAVAAGRPSARRRQRRA